MDNYIRTFREISAGDINIVGGKGANLGEMTRAGLPVPPGFCVTAGAYREFIQASGAMDTIRPILSRLVVDDPEDVELCTEQIRNFLIAQPMSAAIAGEIVAGYRQLAAEMGMRKGVTLPVAVRSSATAEDLPTASFAGQQDTYLNVRGEDMLLEHVKRCWASLWTARAVTYRAKQGFEHEQVALAVVVQAMIQSAVSGIMFTANPVTGNRGQVVINASWGLGEAVVSGQVTPDTYTVQKGTGEIISRDIASKDLAVEYAADGGTVERPVAAELRHAAALADEQIAGLVRLGSQIEDHYHRPMDIEWAWMNGKFYMLQARAITTLSSSVEGEQALGEYDRSMFVEIFPDPLSPLFLSVFTYLFKSMLDFCFRTLGLNPPAGIPATGTFYNQPYFSRRYIEGALAPLSPPARETLTSQIINPFGRLSRDVRFELSLPYLRLLIGVFNFLLRFPPRLPGVIANYRAELQETASVHLEDISDRELIRRITQFVYGPASRLMDYDFVMIALIGITYRALTTLLRRYFGDETEQIQTQLLSGVTGNVTMETNKRIWDLSEIARNSPEVASTLRQFKWPAVREQLDQTQSGKDFLTALDRFLAEYGHREVRMDPLYPTWIEDPAPVLYFITAYLDVNESASPGRQQERLVKQRTEMLEKVRARLYRSLPGRFIIWPIFNRILVETEKHVRERDTMHFEMTRLFPPFRRFLLDLGRRWSGRGLIDRPDDIFFISVGELERLADNPQPMQAKIAERRSEFEANKRKMPPSIIRDGEDVFAKSSAPAQAVEGELRGIAGSPGQASGVARVIRGPEEFGRLKTGEILVAPLTNPVWTPLFAIAGGLVTEVGGILSHGAIVAREYGIPAVMSVGAATQIVEDGQRVTIDGSKGIVRVEPFDRGAMTA